MTYYQKYKIIQALETEAKKGAIFEPSTATKLFKISFIDDFKNKRDYRVVNQAIIDDKGVRAYKPTTCFTKKGIKRLLKTSEQARQYIDELFDDWIRG
ncbi:MULTISPECIES: hypothetical protein [unclassified Campylobacter]|uniref:hypothetical protein n=1 Tax=unclassified Campylobacter TaxID=2593542 RepID=UPI003D33B5A4